MNRRHEQVADRILDGIADPHLVVGPLRWWRSSDGSSDLCFAVTRLLANRPQTTWVHRADEIDRLRLIIALLRGPPLVVHVTEDDRDWTRLCERLAGC
jgi:hypothetical protein